MPRTCTHRNRALELMCYHHVRYSTSTAYRIRLLQYSARESRTYCNEHNQAWSWSESCCRRCEVIGRSASRLRKTTATKRAREPIEAPYQSAWPSSLCVGFYGGIALWGNGRFWAARKYRYRYHKQHIPGTFNRIQPPLAKANSTAVSTAYVLVQHSSPVFTGAPAYHISCSAVPGDGMSPRIPSTNGCPYGILLATSARGYKCSSAHPHKSAWLSLSSRILRGQSTVLEDCIASI
ncbi:hypothetical protein HOY82DRAFT_643057 [Tuber indicum]|nr:hypothetical protein HOY82DRAFT_643057 [Tuber indicum]